MDDLLNPALIWFLIGFILFLLEFAVPGLILFFFGVGAWVVAGLCTFIPLNINIQLLIFSFVSILSVVVFRNSLKKIFFSKQSASSFIDDEFIGKIAKAETAINPAQNGKVFFNGTSWEARSEDTIRPNENITIIGTDSIVLIVTLTK